MSRNIKVSSNPEVNYEYVEDLDPNLVCLPVWLVFDLQGVTLSHSDI